MSTNPERHDPAFGSFETALDEYHRKVCKDIKRADKLLPNHWLEKEGAEFRAGAYLLRDLGTSPSEADPDPLASFREELLALPWETKRTARHEYFMAEKKMTYSYGNRQGGEQPTYTSKPFTEHVMHLMDWLNERMCAKFNACFLNKYDDEHQHLGWHADDFAGMDPNQPIAVVSFGAEREIWVKDKRGFPCPKCSATIEKEGSWFFCDCKGTGWCKGAPNGKQPAEQRFLLKEGSLFVMPVGYQDTHLHRIPKHDRPCGWRISLTFRSFLP